jgi:hypothetical protein
MEMSYKSVFRRACMNGIFWIIWGFFLYNVSSWLLRLPMFPVDFWGQYIADSITISYYASRLGIYCVGLGILICLIGYYPARLQSWISVPLVLVQFWLLPAGPVFAYQWFLIGKELRNKQEFGIPWNEKYFRYINMVILIIFLINLGLLWIISVHYSLLLRNLFEIR